MIYRREGVDYVITLPYIDYVINGEAPMSKCHASRLCDWVDDPTGGYFCRTCEGWQKTKPVSEERRRQNRENQRRYREKKKAKADTAGGWQRKAEEWEARARRAESNANATLAGLIDACGGRKKLLLLIHPDTNGGSKVATAATRYVLDNS